MIIKFTMWSELPFTLHDIVALVYYDLEGEGEFFLVRYNKGKDERRISVKDLSTMDFIPF